MITNRTNQAVDLGKIIKKFKEKYNNIYIFQFEEEVIIYRAVGRKEYRELILNETLDSPEKEEILCSLVTLYPEGYDFTNCQYGGLPTKLAAEIVKNSYISQEDRGKVLSYYRSEMFDVDNQINALVLCAFPTLDLETVENWDVPTACKYYSRAEFILHNIHGLPFKEVPTDPATMYKAPEQEPVQASATEEITDDVIQSTAAQNPVDHNGNPKNKKQQLTPEKLRELQQKYPEIDWAHDEVTVHGIEGIYNQPDVDDTPVALRPRSHTNF